MIMWIFLKRNLISNPCYRGHSRIGYLLFRLYKNSSGKDEGEHMGVFPRWALASVNVEFSSRHTGESVQKEEGYLFPST